MKNMTRFKQLSLIVFLTSFQSILALGREDGPDFIEHPHLQGAQDQVSNAFDDYFNAMMSGTPEQRKAAEQSLHQAQSNVTRIVSETHQVEMKSLYDKVYFEDGRIIEGAEYRKNPALYDTPEKDAKTASNQPSTDQAGASSGQGSPKAQDEGPARPGWALDGSNIPKELIYPGKKKAKKGATQESGRKPASTP